MSKAEMRCRKCGYDWTYSGVQAYDCFCPRCGTQNYLPVDARGEIDYFGFGEKHGHQ